MTNDPKQVPKRAAFIEFGPNTKIGKANISNNTVKGDVDFMRGEASFDTLKMHDNKHLINSIDLGKVPKPTQFKPNHAANPAGNESAKIVPPPVPWWQKPIGIIGIGLIVIALGALVTHIYRVQFGLSP